MDGLAVMVLLRHDLPDGSSHFDWLLERPSHPGLLTFRVQERIDRPEEGSGRFTATRLADHRRAYLIYEGPVSGERGSVTRVAEGTCELQDRTDGIRILGSFGGEVWVYDGQPLRSGDDSDTWQFVTSMDQGARGSRKTTP